MAAHRQIITHNVNPDEDPFEKYLRAQVYTLRRKRGLSQESLAAVLRGAGWSAARQTTVSRIEKGEQTVKAGEIAILADVFDVPVEEMFGRPSGVTPSKDVEDLDLGVQVFRAVYKALVVLKGGQRLTWDGLMTACWDLQAAHLGIDEDEVDEDLHSVVVKHVTDILADRDDDDEDPNWLIPTRPLV